MLPLKTVRKVCLCVAAAHFVYRGTDIEAASASPRTGVASTLHPVPCVCCLLPVLLAISFPGKPMLWLMFEVFALIS